MFVAASCALSGVMTRNRRTAVRGCDHNRCDSRTGKLVPIAISSFVNAFFGSFVKVLIAEVAAGDAAADVCAKA